LISKKPHDFRRNRNLWGKQDAEDFDILLGGSMKTVTFSQLRNNAKKYFDAVENGETVEIFRHGKPIAMLTPVVRETPMKLSRWKTANPIKIPGLSLSKEIIKERRESRW
jgi:prevent-host-death family protein